MKVGDYQAALASFEEADAIFPSPEIYYNIGLAYEKLSRNGPAFMAFERFLQQPAEAPQEYLADARQKLERHIAFVAVACDADADVTLDGEAVGRTPLPSRLAVDTGPHEVAVRVPGGAPRNQRFTAVPGQQIELKFEASSSAGTVPAASLGPPPLPARTFPARCGAGHPPVREPGTISRHGCAPAPRTSADYRLGLRRGGRGRGRVALFETPLWRAKNNEFDGHVGLLPGMPAMTGVDCATRLPHRGGQGRQAIYDDFTHARTHAIASYVATGPGCCCRAAFRDEPRELNVDNASME
jgi:hypothetical protein